MSNYFGLLPQKQRLVEVHWRHMTYGKPFFTILSKCHDIPAPFPVRFDSTASFRQESNGYRFQNCHLWWKQNLNSHYCNFAVKRITGVSLLKDEGALALMFCKSSA